MSPDEINEIEREKVKDRLLKGCKEEIRTMTNNELIYNNQTTTISTKVYKIYDAEGVLHYVWDCESMDVDLDDYMEFYQPIDKYL